LFDEGIAWAKQGGFVDFTTSTVPAFLEQGEVKSSAGLRRMLDAGVNPAQITFTSDGQGSLPDFDAQGRLRRLEIGRVTSLVSEIRDAVRDEGVPLATALAVATANPARILKLAAKGRVAEGADADVLLLDPATLDVRGVVAKGRWLMKDGVHLARGTFETEPRA
jgi:beta-aspartyl-dipeptidase (metallo-type)